MCVCACSVHSQISPNQTVNFLRGKWYQVSDFDLLRHFYVYTSFRVYIWFILLIKAMPLQSDQIHAHFRLNESISPLEWRISRRCVVSIRWFSAQLKSISTSYGLCCCRCYYCCFFSMSYLCQHCLMFLHYNVYCLIKINDNKHLCGSDWKRALPFMCVCAIEWLFLD